MLTEAFLIAILVAGGSLVHAQSLGEAAAKEKERRAKTHGSGKSFSDSDLQEAATKREREGSFPSSEAASPSPPIASMASPKPTAPKEGGAADSAATTEDATDTATIETAKRARGAEYKARLDAANIALKAGEERLKRAEYDWNMVNQHSGPFRMDKANARLEAVRKEVARLKQQRDDIEDAARREGIPPGYMR